jgi:hypothetical protein
MDAVRREGGFGTASRRLARPENLLGSFVRQRMKKAPILMAAILAHAAAVLFLGGIYLPVKIIAGRQAIVLDPGAVEDEAVEQKIDRMARRETPRSFSELPDALREPRIPEPPFPWHEEQFIDRKGPGGGAPHRGPQVNPKDFDQPLSPRPSRGEVLAWFGARMDEKAKTRRAPETKAMLSRGLSWLASVQGPDGGFDPAPYGGQAHFKTGVTGLALLAFLGDGNTPCRGRFAGNAQRAASFLLAAQDPESGRFGPEKGNYMYNHGIAVLAVSETVGMTLLDPPSKRMQVAKLSAAVRRGVAYLLSTQNEGGGWGYSSKDKESDTSVTAWPVAALSTALRLKLAPAGRRADVERALRNAGRWFRHVTRGSGEVGYRKPGSYKTGPHSLTAVSLYCRGIFHEGVTPNARGILEKQIKRVASRPASKAEEADYYFWYYAAFGLRHTGAPAFGAFYSDLVETLRERQAEDGSFSRHSLYGTYGGSVYTTSMALLALEAPYRYPVK